MIGSKDILSLNFYKKEQFTGSYRGMRYCIKKVSENETDLFRVTFWPGPYCYDATDESRKTSAVFPFTEEGKQQAVDYLNEQWELNKDLFAQCAYH